MAIKNSLTLAELAQTKRAKASEPRNWAPPVKINQPRIQQVRGLVLKGYATKDIAAELNISVSTAKIYVSYCGVNRRDIIRLLNERIAELESRLK